MMSLPLALRLARRELAGGARGLRIVLACLALGVAAIAAVGSLRAGIARGMQQDGNAMLGGDMEVDAGAEPLPDALRAWVRQRGDGFSDITTMRSMLIAADGERQLVDLKAVDSAYPLAGTIGLLPAMPLTTALARQDGKYGLVADPVVLDRLGVKAGAIVRLGAAQFRVSAMLTHEPDRGIGPLQGPQVLIATDALPQTALVQPGSLLAHKMRLRLRGEKNPDAIVADVRAAFPNTGWRIRLATDAAPSLSRFIDQTASFMTLAGLTALLVGGIGVATGVRSWLDARANSIATLRCLGAPSRLIFQMFLIQLLALCGCGIVIGVAVGAALPPLAVQVFGDALPIPAKAGLYPGPLLLAMLYGGLITVVFTVQPLARAARIPGAALFRDSVSPSSAWGGLRLAMLQTALAALLVAVTVMTAPQPIFALYFCGAALATLAIFRLGAVLLRVVAARLPRPASPAIRLGLDGLHRPGSAVPVLMVAAGLGLSTLAGIANIERNITGELEQQIPTNAPSFYFIDIQPDQLPRFLSIVAQMPGVRDVKTVPALRARLVSVNGVPAEQVKATPETQWALRGDRGLTYAAVPPDGTNLVAGQWWPSDYNGPPLVSFDSGLAAGWHVGLGDIIRVNVLGRDIDLRVANLRNIHWRSLGLNFAMVASPSALAQAPHANIATLRADPGQDGAILRVVTDAMPNVTGIRVADVLAEVARLVRRIGMGLTATGGLTLLTGVLVLAGAVAAGQRRRIAEAVVLKVVGATAAQLRLAWLVEFGAIGLAAGGLAALVGEAAGWAVMRFVMHADWMVLPGVLATVIIASLLAMLALGAVAAEQALRARVAPLLRND